MNSNLTKKASLRLLSWSLGLLLLALPATLQAQFRYDAVGNRITITGYTGPGGDVAIPSIINGMTVTSIGNSAFYECTGLTSIVIPDSVNSIGNSAFYGCTGLTNVVIENSVASIGHGVFDGCDALEYARIGDGAMLFWRGACPEGRITIQPTIDNLPVTHVGDRSFYGCTGLTSVVIPDSVTSIGEAAFYGCTSLTAIQVDAANPAYSSVDGVLFNKGQTEFIACPGGKTGAYTIPDSVTSIGRSAFSGCTSLTSVTIPNSVTSIGEYAFDLCSSLTAVVIPDSVTGDINCFLECTSLTSIKIGNGVTSIGDDAFSGCSSLSSVTIPDNVTGIGSGAFRQCTSLTSVAIGNGVTSIGEYTFQDCTSMTCVIIGSGVTHIAGSCKTSEYFGGAFEGCISLIRVLIPKSVTSVGCGAFIDCTNLTNVYFEGEPPALVPQTLGAWNATVHYLAGTAGWGPTFADRPTALWIPVIPIHPSVTSYNPLKLVTHSPAPATVRVQRSINLADWEDWQTVSRDAGPSELQDVEAGTTPYRYYRGIEE